MTTKSFTQNEAKGPIKLPLVLNEVKEHLVFDDPRHHIRLYHGDSLELLALLPESSVDLIFGRPALLPLQRRHHLPRRQKWSPSTRAWDKSQGPAAITNSTAPGLAACQRILKPNGSLWVSGTAHVISLRRLRHAAARLQASQRHLLGQAESASNLSCRYFTHATETIIWAARDKKSATPFNYKLMKGTNRGKQMKSVWEIKPPETWEKRFGKHPPKSPSLLERILLASSHEGDLVLRPLLRLRHHGPSCPPLLPQAIALELSYDYLAPHTPTPDARPSPRRTFSYNDSVFP